MTLGYMLPLKFIRVSDTMAICATRIVAIMSTKSYQARRLVLEEKRADTLLNASGRDAVKSVIILDNGSVIASPYDVRYLLRNIAVAGSKKSQAKKIRLSNGLKVYDMIPDELYDATPEDELTSDYELNLSAGDTDGDEDLLDYLEEEGDEDDSD